MIDDCLRILNLISNHGFIIEACKMQYLQSEVSYRLLIQFVCCVNNLVYGEKLVSVVLTLRKMT